MDTENLDERSSALSVTPQQRLMLSEACRTNDPSKLEQCLLSLPSRASSILRLGEYLQATLISGPNYKMIEHLIKNHQVPVTGGALEAAVRLDVPSAEKIQLLDFLLGVANWDINAQVDNRHTLLFYALKDRATVKFLLDRGADPNIGPTGIASSYTGNQLVHDSGHVLAAAVEYGTIEVVELLVQRGAIISNVEAVHCAVECGNVDMLKKVIELGGDVDKEDTFTHFRFRKAGNPLIRATRQGKTQMLEVLLAHNADIERRTYNDESAIGVVAEESIAPEIKELVLRASKNGLSKI